jgi:hypothetical protein
MSQNKVPVVDCNKKGHWIAFFICLSVSIFLMIGSAVVPPPFVVDASIFKCVAWLFAFAALSQIPSLVNSGKTAKIQHGNISVTVSDQEEQEKPVDEDEEIINN